MIKSMIGMMLVRFLILAFVQSRLLISVIVLQRKCQNLQFHDAHTDSGLNPQPATRHKNDAFLDIVSGYGYAVSQQSDTLTDKSV